MTIGDCIVLFGYISLIVIMVVAVAIYMPSK